MKKKINKILMVNDDVEDISALKARLPAGIQVVGMSQAQARMFPQTDADIIILDNDANSLQSSKGKDTLPVLMENSPGVRVIFTSFQPGWVAPQVYQTKGVSVVKTDELPEMLSERFGIKLGRKPDGKILTPKTDIILTYNPVTGYKPGIHEDGRLLIVSFDKMAKDLAQKVMMDNLRSLYQNFDWRQDRGLIRNIFVYDGVNSRDRARFSAASLGHDLRMMVYLLACGCDWEEKRRFASSTYTELYQVHCGGRDELGAIADAILGVKRPKKDTCPLPMPLDKILGVAEKFKI